MYAHFGIGTPNALALRPNASASEFGVAEVRTTCSHSRSNCIDFAKNSTDSGCTFTWRGCAWAPDVLMMWNHGRIHFARLVARRLCCTPGRGLQNEICRRCHQVLLDQRVGMRVVYGTMALTAQDTTESLEHASTCAIQAAAGSASFLDIGGNAARA